VKTLLGSPGFDDWAGAAECRGEAAPSRAQELPGGPFAIKPRLQFCVKSCQAAARGNESPHHVGGFGASPPARRRPKAVRGATKSLGVVRRVKPISRPRTNSEHFLASLRPLPTRADLRDLDVHIGERLDALAARLDRVLES
jgi:hypothetical protein